MKPVPPLVSARAWVSERLLAVVVPKVLVPVSVVMPETESVAVLVVLAFVVVAFRVVNWARVPFTLPNAARPVKAEAPVTFKIPVFVVEAFVVVAFRVVNWARVALRFVKPAVPVNVGEAESANEPVPVTPVTSVIRLSSSAMVSSEVDEILPVKVVQSALVRSPRAEADALGILSVTVPPSAVEADPQLMSEPVVPVVYEVVAVVRPLLPRVPVIVGVKVTVFPVAVIKSAILSPLNELVEEANVIVAPVWIEPAGPIPVIAVAKSPSDEVATHLVEVPVV